MNPNSANQRWSHWTIAVTPGRVRRVDVVAKQILPATRQFARMVFGSPSEMRVLTRDQQVVFEVRTEGHPVHDPAYVTHVEALFVKFFEQFGPGTETTVSARLLAGTREDGAPADQLVMLPPLTVQ